MSRRIWVAACLLMLNVFPVRCSAQVKAPAPKAALVDGYPALVYSDPKGHTTYISFSEYKGDSALKLAVARYYAHGLLPPYMIDGYLLITKGQLIWDPVAKGKHKEPGFEMNAGSVTCAGGVAFGLQVKGGGTKANFWASFQDGQPHPISPDENLGKIRFWWAATNPDSLTFSQWCNLGLTNFRDAEQKFHAAVGDAIWDSSPTVKAQLQAEQQAFEHKAAAWRAAGSKIEMSEEAQRHKVLAEEAVKDKDLKHAAEEYQAGVRVYPTWPEGQYNLALILGELNHYSEAIQHMQMYLILVPDAPDAQKAKEQIWIWQDKEKRGAN